MHTAYILLGSNMGDRTAAIDSAREILSKKCGVMASFSSVVQTAPWGEFEKEDKPQDFLNQVICIKTVLGAQRLMAMCLEVEQIVGRKREEGLEHSPLENRLYRSRIIDIDILLFDSLECNYPARASMPALILPHPRLRERQFAMELLKEIKPDFV